MIYEYIFLYSLELFNKKINNNVFNILENLAYISTNIISTNIFIS